MLLPMHLSSLKNKKVVFFLGSLDQGGAQRVVTLMCNYWVKQGVDVTLVSTYSKASECAFYLAPEVNIVFISETFSPSFLGDKIDRIRAIRKLVKRIKPDLVISFITNVNIAILLSTFGLPVIKLVSERTYPPSVTQPFGYAFLRKYLYPFADSVIMQTQQGLEWLQQTSSKSHGHVIGNPLQYPLIDAEPVIEVDSVLEKGDKVLLAVGRLDPQKGLHILLEAYARIEKNLPHWKLIILGEGEERARLEAIIHEKHLHDRVLLCGQAGNLSTWYSCADAYVMSSTVEGFPNALLEAMSHGLPCVSFDCKTGPRDLIENDVNGMLVPVQVDGAQLSVALQSLLGNDEKRAKLGKQAEQVRERFSLSEVMKQWECEIAKVSNKG